MTLCIHNQHLDPYFNLAAEEYLLQSMPADIFMLWRNQPSIIIGRNQNAYAEINLDFVQQNHIKVVRRLSGGGAVFHDLGNVNFTFIQTNPTGPKLEFERYTEPIIAALDEMGATARFEGRNDLTIDGRKISGNAQHIYKDRVLHHGTLLYSSTISDLTQALKVNPTKFQDKAVQSIRSRVTNIKDHLQDPIPVENFIIRVMDHVVRNFANAEFYEWSQDDLAAIDQLRQEKYSTWEWNFGRSPDYSFVNTARTGAGTLEVHLDIKKGFIQGARLFGDYFGVRSIAEIEQILIGLPHERQAIEMALADTALDEFMSGISRSAFIDSLF